MHSQMEQLQKMVIKQDETISVLKKRLSGVTNLNGFITQRLGFVFF